MYTLLKISHMISNYWEIAKHTYIHTYIYFLILKGKRKVFIFGDYKKKSLVFFFCFCFLTKESIISSCFASLIPFVWLEISDAYGSEIQI